MGTTTGAGNRKCQSWIDSFVEHTENLFAPTRFRRWAAISALAAAMEQKVWLKTSSPIYPNLYVLICGTPGSGKTRTIRAAKAFLDELPEFPFAPNSFTWASLVDAVARSKRKYVLTGNTMQQMEYNSSMIVADEIGTFLHKYEREMSDGLSAFYDPVPYGHERRGNDVRIKIKSPQLNLLCGLTPSTMMDVIPESAWGQGLMSRMIMVFSDEHIIGDDFAKVTSTLPPEMLADLTRISALVGEFKVTEEYRELILNWRKVGETLPEAPIPTHPKLQHYISRRRVNIYKLSMIASIDKSDVLLLDRAAFNTAMGWLADAEAAMPEIFEQGLGSPDGKAMDDLCYFISQADKGKGVGEHLINRWAMERMPIQTSTRALEMLEKSGRIKCLGADRAGIRYFKLMD